MARTPTMDRLLATQAHTELEASGEAVGLPPGVMGNSEVGHLTIGAGRVIYQDLMRITKAIETGAFARNPTLLNAMRAAASSRRTLHLWGLLSDGSVHSHIEHLFALLDLAAQGTGQAISRFTRSSTGATSRRARRFHSSSKPQAKLAQLKCGRIATVIGRYYAMDRDNRWDRTERAWRAIVEAEGIAARDAKSAVERRLRRRSERRIRRAASDRGSRADRGRRPGDLLQLPRRPRAPDDRRARARKFHRLQAAAFSQSRIRVHDRVRSQLRPADRVWPEDVRNTLAEMLARAGIRNLRLAETEKYAHVTYFLNGGVEKPFPMEERALIPSSKVATYDLEPAMRAAEIAASRRAGDRRAALRRDRDQFRQSRHGRPHRKARSDGEGGRSDRRGDRACDRGARRAPAASR